MISLPESLTHIEAHAFQDCKSLQKVVFAEQCRLRMIGDYAFENTSIVTLSIPKYLEVLGDSCFMNCNGLETLLFDDECMLEEIGKCCFKGTNLATVDLPAKLTRLGNESFADCANLAKFCFASDSIIDVIEGRDILRGTKVCHIEMPKYLRKFNPFFLPENCTLGVDKENANFVCDMPFLFNIDKSKLLCCVTNDSSIRIPKNVRIIKKNCFTLCRNLRDVFFESNSCLEKIGVRAFYGCSLGRITLPRSVIVFTESFEGCSLECLSLEEMCQCEFIDTLGSTVISELVLPQHVQKIHESVLSCVGRVIFRKAPANFSIDDPFLFSKDQTRFISLLDASVVEVIVPKYVRILCRQCFAKRNGVRCIHFENGSELRCIESFALQGTSISRFVVPQFVEKIEDSAFSGCRQLRELVFDDKCALRHLSCGMLEGTHLCYLFVSSNVESIEARSLQGIEKVDISSNNTYLSRESPELVRGCGISTLGRIVDNHLFAFDVSTDKIPCGEFKGCEWLEHVSFSCCDRIRSIGASAFCESCLESIDIPSSVESVGASCFEACEKLVDVRFPMDSMITVFKERVFFRSGIDCIVIPAQVREIGEKCFQSTPLSSVTFAVDGHLSVICRRAFESTKLKSLYLPKSLRCLEDYCFAKNERLTTVVFLEGSSVERIGVHCFKKSGIREIVLPPSVKSIGYGIWSGVENVVIDGAN